MLFGGISDRLGRKPILLLGLGCAFSATLLVTVFPTMQALLVARILQGVGVALSVGTGTAYLADVLEEGAALAAALTAVTTSLGFGGGALITSAALWLRPTPVPSSYILTLILSAATLLAVAFLPNPPASGGALMRLPAFPQGSLKLGLAIATAWAVTGLVISVVPTQLGRYGLTVWAGPALFLVNGTGALVQPWVRRMNAERALLVGFALLPLGYALLILGVWQGVLALVLLGASVAGVGLLRLYLSRRFGEHFFAERCRAGSSRIRIFSMRVSGLWPAQHCHRVSGAAHRRTCCFNDIFGISHCHVRGFSAAGEKESLREGRKPVKGQCFTCTFD